MGQATIANLRVQLSDVKDGVFLREVLKKHFENGLAKSFFHEDDMRQLFSETGKYIDLWESQKACESILNLN